MGRRASAPRDPWRAEVAAALGQVRTALAQRGLLLLQDGELPTATTLIVGELRGLSAACQRLLELVEAAPAPVRLDQVTLPAAGEAPRELARELERRLLVHASELHTESGRHVKVLESWAAWQREHGVGELPGPAEARATLEAAVRDWPKPHLPWQA